MASDDASREPRPEPGSEASKAAQGEGDSRSVSDATNLLTRRLRVAETTVEALEAALARKEELLGEASERERTLRAALDAARLEPDASTGLAGSGTAAPGSAGADASAETERAEAAADAWRERALAAESARETAAHATASRRREPGAAGDPREGARAETAERRRRRRSPTPTGGEPRVPNARFELRAAVAEGANLKRARAEEAESALGAWQAHARELTSRLERAASSRAATFSSCVTRNSEARRRSGDEDGDEGGEPSSAESNLATTVASLVTRLEETERLAARLTTTFGVRSGASFECENRQHVSREIPEAKTHSDTMTSSRRVLSRRHPRLAARAPRRRRLRWSGAA